MSLSNHKFTILILLFFLALPLVVYFPSLSGEFILDDFAYLRYLFRLATDRPDLLFLNMSSVFMQAPLFGEHFRPFLIFPFYFDYLVWGDVAFGYHFSSLVTHGAVCAVAFLFSRKFLRACEVPQAGMTSFFAVLMFAVCPLASEAVNWIAARVDSLCAFFYLLSCYLLLCYLEQNRKSFFGVSLFSFFLACGVKEMAYTLPGVVVVLYLGRGFSVKNIVDGLKCSAPYFALLSLFLVVRFLVLGTFLGGYYGVVHGRSFLDRYTRLLNAETLSLIFYPYHRDAHNVLAFHQTILRCLQVLSGGVIALGVFLKSDDQKSRWACLVAFLLMLLTALPILHIWVPSPNLHTGRLVYLPLFFGCLSFCCLLVPQNTKGNVAGSIAWTGRGIVALTALVWCFLLVHSTAIWVEAGKKTAMLKETLGKLVVVLPAEKRFCLLNVPGTINGVSVLYHVITAQSTLCRPHQGADMAERLTFHEPKTPYLENLVNVSGLRKMSADTDRYFLGVYDASCGAVTAFTPPINLNRGPESLDLDISKTAASEDGKRVQYLCRPPEGKQAAGCNWDFLRFGFKGSPQGVDGWLFVKWKDRGRFKLPNPHPEDADVYSRAVRISSLGRSGKGELLVPLSESASWFASENLCEISLDLVSEGPPVELTGVQLITDQDIVPLLSPGAEMLERGGRVFFPKDGDDKQELELEYNCSSVPGADGAIIEVGPPLTLFVDLDGTYRGRRPGATSSYQLRQKGTRGRFRLDKARHPYECWFQVRVFACDDSGAVVGMASDPVSCQFRSGGVLELK